MELCDCICNFFFPFKKYRLLVVSWYWSWAGATKTTSAICWLQQELPWKAHSQNKRWRKQFLLIKNELLAHIFEISLWLCVILWDTAKFYKESLWIYSKGHGTLLKATVQPERVSSSNTIQMGFNHTFI